jgi:YVTN family beta-propeller protein
MSATSFGLRLTQMLRMGGILGILLLVVLPTPGLLAVPSEPHGEPTSGVSSPYRLSAAHGPAPGAPSPAAALPVDFAPPVAQVLPKPWSSVPPATVVSTLNLLNGTLMNGTVVPENGSYPQDTAVDPIHDRLFVATGGGVVTVINTSTRRIVGSIATGFAVAGLAYDPANGLLYGAHYGLDSVAVINATSSRAVTNVSVGKQPKDVTYDSVNGDLYVTNSGSKNVTVIAGRTNRVLTSIAVGSTPLYAAVNTGNGYVFVSNFDDATVSVIDGTTQRVIRTTSVGIHPSGVAYDAANRDVYVVDTGPEIPPSNLNGDVMVLDGSGNQLMDISQGGECPWGIAYDSANGDLFVADTTCQFTFGYVTVINGSTNQVIGRTRVWDYPYRISYDPQNHELYTANLYSSPIGNVSIINGSSQKVVGTVGTGVAPSAIAYGATDGRIYVAEWGNNEVAVINSSSGQKIEAIPVGFGPAALTLDSANNRLYVANFASNNVTVIDTSTSLVTASAPAGSGPKTLVYDPTDRQVYVANANSNNVTVLNGSTLANITSIPVGVGPSSMALDPADRMLFVSDAGPYSQYDGATDWVTVIATTTNRAIHAIPVGTVPWGVIFDPTNHLVYVANSFTGNLSLIDPVTLKAVGSIHIGLYPVAVDYDAIRNEVDVAYADSVAFVDARTNTLLGSVFVGGAPGALAIDPFDDRLFVGNLLSGTFSILQPTIYPPPKFDVVFSELGLPSGIYWSVTLNDSWLGSSNATVSFTELNGAYAFSVAAVPGFRANTTSGTVTVDYADVNVSLAFSPVFYNVTFSEAGLLANISWQLTWIGPTLSTTVSTITLWATNGTYPFTIGTPLGWEAAPSNGTFVVDGSDLTVGVLFTHPLPAAPVIQSFEASAPSVAVNSSVGWVVKAQGSGPLTYSYGGLPPGCRSENLSIWSCTPTRPGEFTVTVVATDVWGRSATSSALLEVTSMGPKTPTVPPNDASFWGLPIWVAGVLVASVVIIAALATVIAYRRGRRKRARGSVRGRSARS